MSVCRFHLPGLGRASLKGGIRGFRAAFCENIRFLPIFVVFCSRTLRLLVFPRGAGVNARIFAKICVWRSTCPCGQSPDQSGSSLRAQENLQMSVLSATWEFHGRAALKVPNTNLWFSAASCGFLRLPHLCSLSGPKNP